MQKREEGTIDEFFFCNVLGSMPKGKYEKGLRVITFGFCTELS
jgi:hypothetical protein